MSPLYVHLLLLVGVLLEGGLVASHGGPPGYPSAGHGRPRKGGPGQAHQHSHKHYTPERPKSHEPPQRIVQDTKLLRDEEHLKEELPDYISPDQVANMSPEEMEFHYFKIHDFDNNYKLDGLEILSAISHIVHIDEGDDDEDDDASNPALAAARKEYRQKKMETEFMYYIEMIDKVLEDDDTDKDGFLSYGEYVASRRN
ncbi:multiple coagulation factor deficiency protein 2 homolog [Oratosquilla oratoria]|uniref:multiple coagulation factor deficiency protein 2 homolog n=1 Tax=Oratosquilla oratoria TaxID=337810 RepID=UPI003F75D1BA